ncbi:Ankyrin repeat family protein [Melia azedarach]|uniref:Ankyrin repeat family protein n=1 Tax=Melia azedarach TaxID=155640 RepID=A0ACC1WVX5_MELAZ|nr:Ankyrin repeat family protein [Melia azedarach]
MKQDYSVLKIPIKTYQFLCVPIKAKKSVLHPHLTETPLNQAAAAAPGAPAAPAAPPGPAAPPAPAAPAAPLAPDAAAAPPGPGAPAAPPGPGAPVAPAAPAVPEDRRRRLLKLYRAALNGDWEVARPIYDNYLESVGVEISKNGDTALHIAAAAKRIDFVKELVKMMNQHERAKPNHIGSTALFFAAASGNVELAREIVQDDNFIAQVADNHDTLPIDMAASLGHKEMVDYLYPQTINFLTVEHRKKLFITCIETDLYDVALQLLRHDQDMATARSTDNNETALHVLARKHLRFSDLSNQNRRGIFKSCAKDVENKRAKALQLVELICRRIVLLREHELSQLIADPRKLIFDAAEIGNIQFLSIFIREYPDLIWKIDSAENKYSIFHIAVKNRQEDIFKLIYEIGSSKEILLMCQDSEGNNILHLAAKLAPSSRLNIVSGAALQMQRELLWFKKVEEVVQRSCAETRNNGGFNPRALFTKEHEGLREKGEKWMKETAASCMVVVALIATVAFAAAITVPGGSNQDTGFPIFLDKISFKIFAISDAISLVFSSASIMSFLSILTSRYTEEDFLWVLPRKLQIGLVTLFISIAAMMVVFSTTYFSFFYHRKLWIAILVTAIASIPVIIFIWQQSQLFYDVLRSGYVSDSLFQQGKNSLFRKQGEASDQRRMLRLKIQCACSTNV